MRTTHQLTKFNASVLHWIIGRSVNERPLEKGPLATTLRLFAGHLPKLVAAGRWMHGRHYWGSSLERPSSRPNGRRKLRPFSCTAIRVEGSPDQPPPRLSAVRRSFSEGGRAVHPV